MLLRPWFDMERYISVNVILESKKKLIFVSWHFDKQFTNMELTYVGLR